MQSIHPGSWNNIYQPISTGTKSGYYCLLWLFQASTQISPIWFCLDFCWSCRCSFMGYFEADLLRRIRFNVICPIVLSTQTVSSFLHWFLFDKVAVLPSNWSTNPNGFRRSWLPRFPSIFTFFGSFDIRFPCWRVPQGAWLFGESSKMVPQYGFQQGRKESYGLVSWSCNCNGVVSSWSQ